MGYLDIKDYGLIGNMRSAALVGLNGSIDWLCLPRFDSPSVFAAILDDEKGGRFSIAPARDGAVHRQFYWPETNILVTRFQFPDAVAELIDFMPVGVPHEAERPPEVVRLCRGVIGEAPVRIRCRPAFDYARAAHETHLVGTGAVFEAGLGAVRELGLSCTVPVRRAGDGAVEAEVTLRAGESVALALSHRLSREKKPLAVDVGRAQVLLRETHQYWRRWIGGCTYVGRWREQVRRSALALKLLTYEPTGAIVAAPTCSLPAPIGGVRNWDYRYTWIRDAAFIVYALMRVGLTGEVDAFMSWIDERCHELEPEGMLLPVYGIDGRHDLPEEELTHLEGYRGSRPVRIGNGAYTQLQLDIAGELMDSVYLYNKYAEPVTIDLWDNLTRILDWVCRNWTREDLGVWEVRGPARQFVYSKVMCWVALDRGVRLADRRALPGPVARWRRARDRIFREVLTRGYDPERRTFLQHYDGGGLDAANLVMPLVFFMSPNEPRMLGTIDAIMRPYRDGGLLADTQVFRYHPEETDDGLPGQEGGFNMCTFWLIEALTRAGKFDPARLEDARVHFEKVLGYANHLGLYAEQTGMQGEALGNFPQGFAHLAFISAAFNLDRALGGH